MYGHECRADPTCAARHLPFGYICVLRLHMILVPVCLRRHKAQSLAVSGLIPRCLHFLHLSHLSHLSHLHRVLLVCFLPPSVLSHQGSASGRFAACRAPVMAPLEV